MQMDAFLWMFLPVFVAGGSALLSYYIMQARMEVALAKERESLAEARALLSSHKTTLEERVKATEEQIKRQALDDFMHDIRVEERSYVKETKSLNAARKTMVMQERIFFRNIPLSNWIEREMVVEDGQDLNQLPAAPVFTANALPAGASHPAASLPNASFPAPSFATSSTMMSASITQLSASLQAESMRATETPLAIARLLNEVRQTHDGLQEVHSEESFANAAGPAETREGHKATVLLTQHATAFGAQ
jgi:hypothetical protein